MNAIRAERKVNIESGLDFYKNLRERRLAEKEALEQELSDVETQIKAREEEIRKENEARQRAYPTNLRQVEPHKGACEYYHCHGTLCGIPDPESDGCGQGATTESDLDCSQFFNSYLQEAGVY